MERLFYFRIYATHGDSIQSKNNRGAYLRVLDDEEKLPNENPSIGIILCKDANRAYVEYVLQDYNKPMGVATYQLRQQQLKELLPDEEEMKKIINTNE